MLATLSASCSLNKPYLDVKSFINDNNSILVGMYDLINLEDGLIKINDSSLSDEYSALKRSSKDENDKCGGGNIHVLFKYYDDTNKLDAHYFSYTRRNYIVYSSFDESITLTYEYLGKIISESHVAYSRECAKYDSIIYKYFY